MKRSAAPLPDPDDMFADTRMTFGEHIEDLRTHLIRAIYGFVIAFLIAIPLGTPVLRYIASPVERELDAFYDRYEAERSKQIKLKLEEGEYRDLRPVHAKVQLPLDDLVNAVAARLGLPVRDQREQLAGMMRGIESLLEQLEIDHLIDPTMNPGAPFVQLDVRISDPVAFRNDLAPIDRIVRPSHLSTFSVQEAFVVLFKVIMMVGLVLGSPWIFYQIWSFVAAGLYPHEKRLVNVYGPFSLGLFVVGVIICELFVIPKAIEAMLWFNELLGFQPDLRLNEWLGFAIFMPLVFGLSFQTPLVMLFMEKIGLFTVESYRNKRRISWFLMAIFAAVITPSTDAFSMLFLWVPMSMLYELGILLCHFSPHDADRVEWEASESEELVEV